MADPLTVRIDGLHQLGQYLSELKIDVAQKLANKAVFNGAKVIKDHAVALAPEWPVAHKLEGVEVPPGNLKANIVTKKIKSPLTSEYIVTVRGKKKDFYAARYGRLVEYGTVNFLPKSFLRKAFDQKKGSAVDAIIDTLADGIEKRVLNSVQLEKSLKQDLGIE